MEYFPYLIPSDFLLHAQIRVACSGSKGGLYFERMLPIVQHFFVSLIALSLMWSRWLVQEKYHTHEENMV